MPRLTAQAQRLQEEQIKTLQHPAENLEDRSFSERCITRGSPQIRAGYQSYDQIVQTPTAVMIMAEMFHDVRVIILDNRPHLPAAIQEWLGDSRGHWEGNTMVVDTTNCRSRAFQSISSEKLHITERLTRQDAETIRYEITVQDPDTRLSGSRDCLLLDRKHRQPGGSDPAVKNANLTKVVLIEKGVWKEADRLFLKQYVRNPASNSVEATPSEHGTYIDLISIDEAILPFGLKRVDFIKMDVEGSEVRALEGAAGTIRSWRAPNRLRSYSPEARS